MKNNKVLFLSIIFLISFSYKHLNGQGIKSFQYLNPMPNSSYVSINSNIIIRQGSVISRASINNDLIDAVGAKSGVHKGKVILADDSRTLVFTPFAPFQNDEEVTVTLKHGLMTVNGSDIGKLIFKFHTCINSNKFVYENDLTAYKKTNIVHKLSSSVIPDSSLPPDLPAILVDTSNNPSPGYFLFPASPYLEIIDNEGTPIFYRYVGGNIYNFDLQPNGELTYFVYPHNGYQLDSSYNVDRTFSTTNGFDVNVHDLRVLPNGNYYIFGGRYVTMDLSQYGGDTNAAVSDGALQEFDSTGNLIFQWDAIDHYKITDVDDHIDLTQPKIDFTHFNSIAIDTDGNPIVSARNLDEITKIDHNTGDIIWRWGGKNNQFTLINDNLGFSRQHDIRRFSNGDFSLFDNGVYHPTPLSSAVEYKLDETNKTATLIYRIYHKSIYSEIEGSVQELPNGNRVISWGRNWNPVVSEVKTDGSTVIDLSYTYFIDNYRAFKYQWRTNLFSINTDSLNFGEIADGDSAIKYITIYNPQDTALTINEFYNKEKSFSVIGNVPLIIKPKDSVKVQIMFKPLIQGTFKDKINLRIFGYRQMIARQVYVYASTITAINNKTKAPSRFKLYQNYPNPFNPTTKIEYSIPKKSFVSLKVFDVLGREVETLVNEEKLSGNYEVEFNGVNLSSGIYFYELKAGVHSLVKKMIVIK